MTLGKGILETFHSNMMADKKPTNIIHYRQKGWLKVGQTRMVLFDILQGYYNIRQVIKKEVGDNANYLTMPV